jgi:HEAT repeat protein/mono/diheme cytochrome c family protein
MSDHSVEALLDWLDFPDQRLRLRAQFELARRREIAPLVLLVRDPQADTIARLHALWGLGQIGAEGLLPLEEEPEWIAGAPEELRAQLARVAGDARAVGWIPRLRAGLVDPSLRIRFFAAQALGQLADRESVEPLVALLRENADRDVFLRHAAVLALHRIGDLEAVLAHRDDLSRPVRMAVLLVLRQAGDPRIASFLADADPLIAVEAARAIYDLPIDGAMPALAARMAELEPAGADDRQVGQALHRRVIGANVRLRREAGAARLAHYVADERQLSSLRELALDQLSHYAEPPTRDLAMGFHRPLPRIAREVVASVLFAEGRALVESSLGARALEVAGDYGVSPLSDAELIELVESTATGRRERSAALNALRARLAATERGSAVNAGADGAALRRAVDGTLTDSAPEIRMAALDLLAVLDPAAAFDRYVAEAAGGEDPSERRHAWRWLGTSSDARARDVILRGLVDWQAGTLGQDVALDVFEAALAQGEPQLAEQAKALFAPSSEAPVESRRWALEGGDPVAGRRIFQTIGDCQRCHGDPEAPAESSEHGGRIGPDLAGVAGKGSAYVLESVLVPDARIAEGFPSPSAMPPVGLLLEPAALRDLVAYVMSFD